jgi:hypothetical protein
VHNSTDVLATRSAHLSARHNVTLGAIKTVISFYVRADDELCTHTRSFVLTYSLYPLRIATYILLILQSSEIQRTAANIRLRHRSISAVTLRCVVFVKHIYKVNFLDM